MADTGYRGRAGWVRMRRLLIASGLALLVGLLAACSSDDGGSGGSTSADPASETAVAFGGPDDEAAEGAATTAAVPDDAESTVPAGEASSPADDEIAAVEAEVERVIQRNWEIWVECTTDVDNCDPETALAETESTDGQFYLESVGVVELWQQQGIAYRAVEGRPVDRFVEIQSIDVAADLTSAEVMVCDRDDRARFERNSAGEYEMVEGTDFAEDLLLRRVVAEADGEWKIVENELLERRAVTEGIDPLC